MQDLFTRFLKDCLTRWFGLLMMATDLALVSVAAGFTIFRWSTQQTKSYSNVDYSIHVHRVPECLSLRRHWVPPPPQASVPPPLTPSNTRLRVRGWGGQFGQLDRKPGTLCVKIYFVIISPICLVRQFFSATSLVTRLISSRNLSFPPSYKWWTGACELAPPPSTTSFLSHLPATCLLIMHVSVSPLPVTWLLIRHVSVSPLPATWLLIIRHVSVSPFPAKNSSPSPPPTRWDLIPFSGPLLSAGSTGALSVGAVLATQVISRWRSACWVGWPTLLLLLLVCSRNLQHTKVTI